MIPKIELKNIPISETMDSYKFIDKIIQKQHEILIRKICSEYNLNAFYVIKKYRKSFQNSDGNITIIKKMN